MTDFHNACRALDSHQTRTVRQCYMSQFENIAQLYGTCVREILGPSQALNVLAARRECIKTLRGQYKMGVCQIGRIMKRDHSTISYTLAKYGEPNG